MAVPIPTPVYHLTHIDNLASIIQSGGCLSFNQKQNQGIGHIDVAYETIQVRRAQTSVPCGSGGCLHDYVLFFFAPRPPMLYAIHRGYVEGYEQGQTPLIYMVTKAQTVNNSGSEWVFTDGHATMAFSEFFDDLKDLDEDSGDWAGDLSGRAGSTVLDQLHQSMILFGAGRGEALKRFLVADGIGMNPLYWRLAQALSALYPSGTDEKRWVDGVLARGKRLGL